MLNIAAAHGQPGAGIQIREDLQQNSIKQLLGLGAASSLYGHREDVIYVWLRPKRSLYLTFTCALADFHLFLKYLKSFVSRQLDFLVKIKLTVKTSSKFHRRDDFYLKSEVTFGFESKIYIYTYTTTSLGNIFSEEIPLTRISSIWSYSHDGL